jgi:hypothetical protein
MLRLWLLSSTVELQLTLTLQARPFLDTTLLVILPLQQMAMVVMLIHQTQVMGEAVTQVLGMEHTFQV